MSFSLALRSRVPPERKGSADAVLAALVIAVVGLMVVPLPTWLLDILLAANLAFSVTLLLLALYVSDALKIAAFPTLLLVTTLMRLALNVSSTRLILLQGFAGEVIQAFGQFVVRGNYVVGGVIFLVLALIQFIVIAKGSERVAEVGARFTLDAMPGKQMAIDAELRSGAIDGEEARRRRRTLARESQFYGAMDGAMKFVKGDVIASFLITAINLLAGLAVGVGQKDMAAGDALKRYGLLTIGDGLVTQIPALVISTAAGVLVTRVASEEADTPLGEELAAQIFGAPRALRMASLFVLLLAVVPGLPSLPFLTISGLLFAATRARSRPLRREEVHPGSDPVRGGTAAGAAPRFVPFVIPWSLAVSPDLEPLLEDETRGGRLKRVGIRSVGQAIQAMVFRQLGVPLPACRIDVDEQVAARHVVLSIYEVPAKAMVLSPTTADEAVAEQLVSELLEILTHRATDFVGISETQSLLDQLEQIAPATVRQVVPKPVSVALLTDILRRLVEEGVTIRDLRGILESLAVVANTDKDPLNLTEFVRSQMRRSLTYRLTQGHNELLVILLDPTLEEAIRGAISRTTAGSFLTLAPAAGRDIVAAVQRAMAGWPSGSVQPHTLLTQPDIRRFVRKLVETDLGGTQVISYAELLPEVVLKPVGRATLRGL
ncbi:FHIPEP family type III secretion protein [Myxococcota bacterium]